MRKQIIDNRYKVINKIGVGATGTVYKVKDLKNNSILALKILSKQKTYSELVQRFEREFRLLAQLHHPNLCAVYDFGRLADGRSYFTMEHVDGENIFKATKEISYKEIYPLVVQLCRALEYIHAKGLIHYDIKPGNVLVAKGKGQGDEGNKRRYAQNSMLQVKLMDFGLAGEQRIKGGTLIKGTFPYIAPEVIKGLAVDYRADLYSLGVVLYEIFTRKSFREEKESFVTLLQQRIRRGSAFPPKIAANIPKRLEQLLMQLFAYDPAVRLSRANEVIVEINKLSRSKFALETEKTIEGYLLSSRFVGRDREMQILQSLHEKARKHEGNVVLVTGNAGIGKSRFLKEFKIYTQLQRSHSFIGYAHKDKTQTLEPFYDIFKELINYIKNGVDLLRSYKLKTTFAVLSKIFPDITDRHLKKNLPKLAPLDPQQEKLRNFEALSQLIEYCTKVIGEFVILLEDLHWADDLTIQFLEYLSRTIANRNILICGTSRKQALKENQALKKMIFNLSKTDYFTQIELGPLKFKNLYTFLDSAITPNSNSSKLVRYLMKKTGGNPFFVEEIMRTLLQKGEVKIGERITIENLKQLSVPETIEDIVSKRTGDLDRNSRIVIKFAVVLLKEFNYDLIKCLTDLDDTEISRSLWELRRKQILIEKGNNYEFYHTILHETLNKRLSYREKKKLSYRIGITLETINKKNKEQVVEDLAYYFINARDRKKGIRYALQAAKKSTERYAYEQAIQFYKRVLSLLSIKKTTVRFEILQQLAKTEVFVDHYDDAIKYYNEALRISAGSVATRIYIYIGLGGVHWKRGEHDKALRVYLKAKKLLYKLRSGALKMLLVTTINVRICRAYQILGDYKRARMFNFDSIPLPLGINVTELIRLQANLYTNLYIMENYRSKYEQTSIRRGIAYCKSAYTYYKKIHDEEGMASVYNNLGVGHHERFEFQKAISYYRKALRIFEKIRVHSGVATTLRNLSNIYRSKADYIKALDYIQKALVIGKKVGNFSIIGDSLFETGNCYLGLCNLQKAKVSFNEAIMACEAINWEEKKFYSMQALGTVHRNAGNYSKALRCYKNAFKFFDRIKHQQGLIDSYVHIGALFIEIGNFSTGKQYIEKALSAAITTGSQNMISECYIYLCMICVLSEDTTHALNYYRKGIKIAKQIKMKRLVLWLFVLIAEIYYLKGKYLQGLKFANKACMIAKKIGAKDLYISSLLIKIKNGIKQGQLSRRDATRILEEAKKIAEEIQYPAILWKVYFAYARNLHDNQHHHRASTYYQRCIAIFKDVVDSIKNDSYKRSYLNRQDRRSVFMAISEM